MKDTDARAIYTAERGKGQDIKRVLAENKKARK